eukprot:m.157176 g.157176  ORF g.157176 m.157176 type:complete len:87 (+) comp38704_c0_seq3:43-303(+)
MDGRHATLEETVAKVKEELSPRKFYDFLRLLSRAVNRLLESNGKDGRAIDKSHALFGSIIRGCDPAMILLFMIGFEDIPGGEHGYL